MAAALFCLEGLRGGESQEKHLDDGYLKYGVELLVDLHNAESIRARLEDRLAAFSLNMKSTVKSY